MTKKDYIKLAKAVNNTYRKLTLQLADTASIRTSDVTLTYLMSELSEVLKQDNPAFDADTFEKVCKG